VPEVLAHEDCALLPNGDRGVEYRRDSPVLDQASDHSGKMVLHIAGNLSVYILGDRLVVAE